MSNDSALAEARGLYRMLGTGHTLEEVRKCIGVPSKVERKLRLNAAMNPVEARWVEQILMFRNAVAQEFDLLVRAGAAASEPPETGTGSCLLASQGNAASRRTSASTKTA